MSYLPFFSLKKITAFLLLLLPCAGGAQAPSDWIEKGKGYYHSDQLDSAIYCYRRAFQSGSADIQVQAVSGMISAFIYRSEFSKADSVMVIAEKILRKRDISPVTRARFRIKKGEYFKYNSQFQKAINEHREVIKLSRALENDPSLIADANYYAALTFERLSQYDSSLIYVNRAYDIYKNILDTNSIQFANIYNGLGVCYYRNNLFDQAKYFYQRSIEIAREQLGEVSSDLAIALSNLASIARAEENYQEAIAFTEDALRQFRQLGDQDGISSTYYSLGVYYYFLGDYGKTKDYMLSCIALREELYDAFHYSLIGPYEVLGIAFEESGDYEKTLQYLSKVRPIIIKNYGPDSQAEGFNKENTALCYQSIGQLDSALYYMKASNRILENNLESISYPLGTHYFNYANILYELGQYDQAYSGLNRSRGIYEGLGLAESAEYGQVLALFGLIAAEKDQWIAADRWFDQALNKIKARGLELPIAFEMTPNALILLNQYTGYLFDKYQSTGEPEALEQYEAYTAYYLSLSQRFRKQFNDPYTNSILIKNNSEAYSRYIGAYVKLYQHTQDEDYLNAIYQLSENSRANLLRDLQNEQLTDYANIPDTTLARGERLKKRLQALNAQLIESEQNEPLRQQLFELRNEYDAYTAYLSENYPAYYRLQFRDQIIPLSSVQQNIPAGENIIEFMLDDTAYYTMVINPKAIDVVYLGNKKAIDQLIRRWRKAVSGADPKVYQLGYELYQSLWQPLEGSLSGNKVVVVPVSTLFYLSLEGLCPTKDGHRFLIQDYNISYSLSLDLYFSEQPSSSSNSQLLAIAPGFEASMKQAYLNTLDSNQTPDQNYIKTLRQPWAVKLAKELGRQYNSSIITGAEATEATVKSSLSSGNLIYFGTHAVADPADPLRSRLILAKQASEQEEDGYLHVYELYALSLQSDLAILNACESGIGELKAGEGMISLAYGLRYAGCNSSIMSLWKVDEKTSTDITRRLIDRLNTGQNKSKALRTAKLEFLHEVNTPLKHPFYWSGMILLGNDKTLDLKQKTAGFYLIPLLAIFLGGFIFFLIRKRRSFYNFTN